ncbi:hypothetical protein TNCV_620681 [Trichonephila clavipes]|nr:hypothetical protein TNCV_620681 [Trichonephila clavipes]
MGRLNEWKGEIKNIKWGNSNRKEDKWRMEKEGYPNGVMRNGQTQIGKWRNGERRNGETERVERKNGERRNEDTQMESSNGGKVKWGTEKCGNSQR